MEYRKCMNCGKDIKTLGVKYCAECAKNVDYSKYKYQKKVKLCTECGQPMEQEHGNVKLCNACRTDRILIPFYTGDQILNSDYLWLKRKNYSVNQFVCEHIDDLKEIIDYMKRHNKGVQ